MIGFIVGVFIGAGLGIAFCALVIANVEEEQHGKGK